jgi:hypothetical protein
VQGLRGGDPAVSDYALARALIEVRLAELRRALDRHETERRSDGVDKLERVEAALATLLEELACGT